MIRCWSAVDITIVKLKPVTQKNDLGNSYFLTIATYLIYVLYLIELGERRDPPLDSGASIIISVRHNDRPPSDGGVSSGTSMLPFISNCCRSSYHCQSEYLNIRCEGQPRKVMAKMASRLSGDIGMTPLEDKPEKKDGPTS